MQTIMMATNSIPVECAMEKQKSNPKSNLPYAHLNDKLWDLEMQKEIHSCEKCAHFDEDGVKANVKQEKLTREVVKKRLEGVQNRLTSRKLDPKPLLWKTISPDGLIKEFTHKGLNAPRFEPQAQHRLAEDMRRHCLEVFETAEPDWDYTYGALSPVDEPGYGFGVGLANYTTKIFFAAKHGAFESLQELQDYYQKLEQAENPCLNIGEGKPRLGYTDTLKYYVTQHCAALKFMKTSYEAAKFALDAMKRNAGQMNAFAVRTIGLMYISMGGVDNTTDWSKLTNAPAYSHKKWTTDSLISMAKQFIEDGQEEKLKEVKKELVRRCEPEYAEALLGMANDPTKQQHHRWHNRVKTDLWLRNYTKETQQVQSNHAELCRKLCIYTRYREKINLIPYNTYIYSKFTVPTPAQFETIHNLFPFEVTLNALAMSDRTVQGTMGYGDEEDDEDIFRPDPVENTSTDTTFPSEGAQQNVENILRDFTTTGMERHPPPESLRLNSGAYIRPQKATFGDIPQVMSAAARDLQNATDAALPVLEDITSSQLVSKLNAAATKVEQLVSAAEGPVKSVAKLAEKLEDPKVKKFLNTQVESVTKVMSKNEDVAVILKPLTAMIRAYIPEVIMEWPGFKEALDNFPWFTMLLSYMAYQKTNNKLARSVIIGNFLVQLGGVKLVTTVLNNIAEWLFSGKDATGTSGGSDSMFSCISDPMVAAWEYVKKNGMQVGMIGAALAGVCAVLGLAWSKHDKRDESVAARLATTFKEAGFISNGIRSLGNLGRNIAEIATTFFSWLYFKVTGNEWVKPEDGLVKKALTLRSILDFYDSDAGKNQLYNHQAHRDCAKQLMHEADVCMTQIYGLTDKRMVSQLANILAHPLSTLKKNYYTAVEMDKNRPTERVSPFVLAFVGGSGTGKTEMSKSISAHLNKEIFNSKEPTNIFSWNPNAKFQDAYSGQQVCMVEEVNAIQSPEFVVQLLTLFSSAPMTVDKARVEEKGQAVRAEVFVTTSNTKRTVAEKLTAPWAIDRRRHIVIEPKLKREFRLETGKPDLDKIKAQSREDSESFNHCDFYVLNSSGDDITGNDHMVFRVTYPQGHAEYGNRVFRGSANPLSWPEVKEIAVQCCHHHRAQESAITNTDPFKNAIADLKFIGQCITQVLEKPKKLWGFDTSPEKMRRTLMAQLVEDYEKLTKQIDTLNAYKRTHEVPTLAPLPKLEDFLGEVDTEGTSAQTIAFMNGKKEINLAHPKYIGDEGIQVHARAFMPQTAVPQVFDGRGDDYDLRVPAVMIRDVRSVKTVAVPMDIDFVRMVGVSPYNTIIWKGMEEYSFANVMDQGWFKRSFTYWNGLELSEKLQFINYVEDTIEPVVANRIFFIKYWYSSRQRFREFSMKYLSPIAAFFTLSNETRVFMRMMFGIILTAIALTAIAVIVELYAPEPQYHGTMNPYSGTTTSSRAAQIAATGIPQSVARKTTTEGTCSGIFMEAPTNNVEAIIAKVSRNLRVCYVNGDSFQGIFLKSNILLIPAHCAVSVKSEGFIDIYDKCSAETIRYQIDPRDIVDLGQMKDQALLHIREHTMTPDITKYIPDTCDVFAVKQAPISILAYTTPANRKQIILRETRHTGSINPETNFKVNGTTEMGDAMSYEARAPLGSSGGMVFTLANKEQNHPLFAIQSARANGLKNKSFVSVLNKRELIQLCDEMLEVQYQSDQELADTNVVGTSNTPPPIFSDGQVALDYVGEIENHKYVASPYNVLGYVKSPIYTVLGRFYPETRQPSIMNLTDQRWQKFKSVLVDPMQHSLLKTVRDKVIHWSHEEIDIGVQAISDYLQQTLGVVRKPLRVLTIEEAIHDDENRMNPHTSAGMPWKARIDAKGKEGLFRFSNDPERPGTIEYLNESFYDECVQTLAAYRQGLVPPSHSYIFAKSELRPVEKLFKTRSIDVVSATTGVVFRQLHQDLTNRMIMLGDGSQPWTFGINPNSYHWQTMATHLKATAPDHMDPKCFDLDISNWDGHMTQQIAVAVARICSNCYGSDDLARKAMAMEMIGSYSAFERFVFKKNRGMCSGWPGTTLYNTVGHILIGYMIYRRIMKAGGQLDKLTFQDWLFYTCPRYYGDDNVTSVRPEIQGFYNGITVSNAYTQAGLPATPGTKTNQFTEFLPLSEVTFLKRSFVWDASHHIWLAPLDKGVIYDMVRWIRVNNKNLVMAQFVSNFYDARQEICNHGPEEFTLFQTLVLQAAQNCGVHCYIPVMAYSDIMAQRLQDYYNA